MMEPANQIVVSVLFWI